MNLTPDPVQIIAHLRDQIAAKSEEAATNWSGMQILHQRCQELEQENTELKQRLLAYEGDVQPEEEKEAGETPVPAKRTVKKAKTTQR